MEYGCSPLAALLNIWFTGGENFLGWLIFPQVQAGLF